MNQSDRDAEVRAKTLFALGVNLVLTNGVLLLLRRLVRRRDERGSTAAAVLATLGVVVVLAAIVVGGYLGGWWLQKDVQNRQSRINRASYEQQTTYRDEMIRKIADVRAIDAQISGTPDPDVQDQLKAQRSAVVAIVCRDNTHIQGGLDQATESFVGRECA